VLKKYIEIFKASNIPISILDMSLRTVWSNDFIITHFEAMSNEDYLDNILSKTQMKTIMSAVSNDQFKTIKVKSYISCLATVSFAPIYSITKEEQKKSKNVEKNKKPILICAFYNMAMDFDRENLNFIVGFESKMRCALANVFTSVNAIQSRNNNDELLPDNDIDIFLKQITNSTYQVLNVIDNLSSYSKIIDGTNKCNFEVVKCLDFFENLLYAIKSVLMHSGLEINYSIKIDDNLFFNIDKEKIRRFILKIISMSIENDTEGAISRLTVLKIENIEEDIIISFVYNNITKDEILGIDNSKDNFDLDIGQNNITKRIIEDTIKMHSGKVDVAYEQNKKGTVAFTLPCFRMNNDLASPLFSSYDKSENLMMDKFSSIYIELSDIL
ncbi:MAG: hypothetical protein RSC41_05030, partial [Oscillospiraceae bacterium]